MKILVKFPTRGRRRQFLSTLDLYLSMAVRHDLLEIRVTIDDDDDEMNHPDLLDRLATMPGVSVSKGNSSSKVDAINRDMGPADWDIVLLASDDMIPVEHGYDETIRNEMASRYPDTDGVLWFNDGNRTDLNTLTIMGRRYYERFGYLYHPSYRSLYCDKELTIVGNLLKRQAYIDRVIIRHEHPDYGYGSHDEVYAANDLRKNRDLVVFMRRQSMNFGIGSPVSNLIGRVLWECKWFIHRLRRGALFG